MSAITNIKKYNGQQVIYAMDIYGETYPIVRRNGEDFVEMEMPEVTLYYGCNNSFEKQGYFKELHKKHIEWINSEEYKKKKEEKIKEKKKKSDEYIKKLLNKKRKREAYKIINVN